MSSDVDPGPAPVDLPERLQAWARGHLPTEAAVDLLIDHGPWPERLFRGGHVDIWTPADGGSALAAINWATVTHRVVDRGVSEFAASSSEHTVLAVALSLAGEHEVRLGALLPCLDATNTVLVATAVATACNSGVSLTAHGPPPSTVINDLLAPGRSRGSATDVGRLNRTRR